MNLIALINTEVLYAKALEEQVPYFKFGGWIESSVQKEVIAQLFKSKGGKGQIPEDLITQGSDSKKGTQAKRRSIKQKNDMKDQLIAFLNKAKDIKMPKMPAMP